MTSASNEITNAVIDLSQQLGFKTFADLPSKKYPYPYVIVGDIEEINAPLAKLSDSGYYTLTIDILGSKQAFGVVDEIASKLKKYEKITTDNYTFVQKRELGGYSRNKNTDVTNTVITHGILTLAYVMQKGN